MGAGDSRPLAGKRIVVTRAAEQAGELARRLEALGAEVLCVPAVAFADPQDTAGLDAALQALRGFDWLLFTSQNAVRYCTKRAKALRVAWPPQGSGRLRFAAVGPATARAAEEEGLPMDRVAGRYRAEGLAEELAPELAGKRVLLPRSDRARSDLPAALRAAGAEVVEVVAYRTVAPAATENGALEQVRRGKVDAVTFASPSAVQHFAEAASFEALQRIAGSTVFAAIGPVTAQALREAGLPVAIETRESTSAGLAAALAEYWAERAPSGGESP